MDPLQLVADAGGARALARASAAGGLTGAPRLVDESDEGAAAREFEAVLATLLVKEMRKGMAGEFFGEGSTADIYGGWFDEHVGRSLAESGALDLAGMVKSGLDAATRTEIATAMRAETAVVAAPTGDERADQGDDHGHP